MQHGSLQNTLFAHAKQEKEPEVGMGATRIGWSDRYAYTIIEVAKSKKKFKIQRDNAIRIDKNGFSEDQDYRYETNLDGGIEEVYMSRAARTLGQWVTKGSKQTVLLDSRSEYYDPHF